MTRRAAVAGWLAAAAGVAAGCALSGAVAQNRAARTGYLPTGSFDVVQVLPPAPTPGDARARADRADFRRLRKLAGTPRWTMATNDVLLSNADLARDYSCSVGIALTLRNAPLTIATIDRASIDTSRQTVAAKDFYKRQRPPVYDRGPVCQPIADLIDSYDYPSGHTTIGWTWATILARLAPDRATAILARGRAFGDSRAVCGAHNASAVEGGFVAAAATMDAVDEVPAFQADLAAARREIDALRADPATRRPDGAACAAETALVAQRIY